jgi:recombination protein RecA
MFGNPETTTGGRALKFYTSVRIDLRRKETIKNGEIAIGNRIRAKVVKNKMAPPFREAEFDILFAEGIWRIGSILDVATELNVIQKTGSWLAFGEEKIGQGKENAAGFLKENPNILNDIEKKIRERVAVPV